MDLAEELYSPEEIGLRKIWDISPFYLFSPNMSFLRFKPIVLAIREKDQDYFIKNIRNNFIPDKNTEDVLETKRNAINRGIDTLNNLCKTHIPQAFPYLSMERVKYPFDPLKMITEAREKWILGGSGRHLNRSYTGEQTRWLEKGRGLHAGDKNNKLIIEAYNAVKSWGLGHFILIIDESPEIFNSVSYRAEINKWFQEKFNFTKPVKVSEGNFLWNTRFGIPVYSSGMTPIRQRAKIYDESGNMHYSSLLIKMFLKEGFLDKINDTYGIEMIVKDDEAVREMVHIFRKDIRGANTLEKYDCLEKIESPAFRCTKFILRIPIRLLQQPPVKSGETREKPLEKYIRVPVEIQLRPIQETNHHLYERNKYLKVFPLWYPREIFEHILKEVK